MKDKFISRMAKFAEFTSVSSNERKLLEYIRDELAPFVPDKENDLRFDPMGNLIAVLGRGCGEKVMFSSHADTIGFIAHYIDDNGFVRVTSLGGLNPYALTNREVRFANGVRGIIAFEPDQHTIAKAYVDIGAASKEEASKMLPLGTVGTFVSSVYEIGGEKPALVSPFMDDRIACAIQMEAFERIAKCRMKLANEFYFVFSVQEELGLRGSKTAAFGIEPKYGIALDVTSTGDTPEANPPMTMKLGGGACIKVMDRSVVCNKQMVDFMIDTAEKNDITHQIEILPFGGTDTASIQMAAGGAYAGAISIPTRYIHTPTETVNVADCEACVELLCALITAGFRF